MRKVTVKLEMQLVMLVDEGVEISQVVNELDYNVSDRLPPRISWTLKSPTTRLQTASSPQAVQTSVFQIKPECSFGASPPIQ